MDRGLVWAAGGSPPTFHVVQFLILSLGDAHKRQRKVMKPAFDLDEANALYPCFARCSRSVSHFPIHDRSIDVQFKRFVAC